MALLKSSICKCIRQRPTRKRKRDTQHNYLSVARHKRLVSFHQALAHAEMNERSGRMTKRPGCSFFFFTFYIEKVVQRSRMTTHKAAQSLAGSGQAAAGARAFFGLRVKKSPPVILIYRRPNVCTASARAPRITCSREVRTCAFVCTKDIGKTRARGGAAMAKIGSENPEPARQLVYDSLRVIAAAARAYRGELSCCRF